MAETSEEQGAIVEQSLNEKTSRNKTTQKAQVNELMTQKGCTLKENEEPTELLVTEKTSIISKNERIFLDSQERKLIR
ncbi:hypothetical protein JZO67_003587 [Enterococcus sp. 665A]|uniref:Uncharacterized protein n=1 Tax=Candidatus Enterococcus ferrettii TaxID=2815324 RepID=A0ABV0ESM3_9ENTE